MNDSTYEAENTVEKLETYEWDNPWIEQANDIQIPRVLYIGDSISRATRSLATERSGNTILFDNFATSKAVDNPFFPESVVLFAKQTHHRNAVIFNNGLHGWHLDDESEYAKYYEDMIQFLLKEFSDVPVAVVLTTHVADSERDKRVVARNSVAKAIAEKYSLPVIDFYKVSVENKELLSADGNILADFLLEALKDILK